MGPTGTVKKHERLEDNPHYLFIKQVKQMCADLPEAKVSAQAIVEFVKKHDLLIKKAPHLVHDSLDALNRQVQLLGEPYLAAAQAVKPYLRATGIESVPLPYMISKIFPATTSGLGKIAPVCKNWQALSDAVRIHYINEQKLPLNKWFKNPAQAVAFFTHSPLREQVRHLDFTSFPIDDDQLQKILESCPNVTHLILFDNNVTGDFLKHLRNVTKLIHLNIQFCSQLDPDSLKYLQHVPLLQDLNVAGCDQLEPDFLRNLRHVPLLRSLIVQSCPLKNDDLRHLNLVPQLTVLDVSLCRELAADSLKNLAHVPLLLELYLAGCGSLATDSLKHLAFVRSLVKLSVSGCIQFTPESFHYLSHVGSLLSLNASHCEQLTTLQFLELLPLLASLDIANCNGLSPDALIQLQRVSKLTSLIMAQCSKFEPEALHNLRFVPGLTLLDITGCKQLSVNSINNLLIQMRALRTLNMAMCPQIPHVRREQMKKEFPQVRII